MTFAVSLEVTTASTFLQHAGEALISSKQHSVTLLVLHLRLVDMHSTERQPRLGEKAWTWIQLQL